MDSATSDPPTVPPEEILRARLYALLVEAFSSPVGQRDASADLWELATELPPALAVPAQDTARSWSEARNDSSARDLAYARLFLGPFDVQVPPYASLYLDPEHRIMGTVSREVARTYAEAGFGPDQGFREAPDHIAVEWEFLYSLTYRYAETGEPAWREQREKFRDEHALQWMPRFAEDVRTRTDHPFYQNLATLLAAVCAERF